MVFGQWDHDVEAFSANAAKNAFAFPYMLG